MIRSSLVETSSGASIQSDETPSPPKYTCKQVSTSTFKINTSDGIQLSASVYKSGGRRSRGVAIVAAGVGLLQERYSEYATYLAGKGWTVLTFDYRGIGESYISPELQSSCNLRDWGKLDLAACIDWADAVAEAQRIVVIAHSVGGQVFAFAPNNCKVEAMIAICSQKGYWKFWCGWRRVSLMGLWYVLPVLVSVFGCLPLQRFGRGADIPSGIAREWGRWGRCKAFVDERGKSLNHVFSKVRSRILAVSFSDDNFYAPQRAVEALNELYRNSDQSHWHLNPKELNCSCIGHSGFFVYSDKLYPLWENIDGWLNGDSRM